MTALINVRRVDKAAILDVSGDIDLASSPEMRKVLLHEVRENRKSRVICNLSHVNYIDSSGIASFVEGLKAARDVGSRLILFGLSPPQLLMGPGAVAQIVAHKQAYGAQLPTAAALTD